MLNAIRNTMANYAGGMATLAAMLIFNAVYFRMVGGETFSLISLLLTLSLMLPALDLGVARTAGRELAIALAQAGDPACLRDTVVTLQLTNAAVGIAFGALVALAAPIIATGWLRPQGIAVEDVALSVMLIGANIPVMLPRNFVVACLNGMKRQILCNALVAFFTLLRGFAGLVALSGENPLKAFFVSQLLAHAIEVAVGVTIVSWLMPAAPRRPRFRPVILRRIWRFAAGDGAANLIGVCLAQGDKLLLSTLLPLSSYGAYALISTVANGVGRFTSPFSAAFLPHFVELTALGREDELRADYLQATQLLGCVILPLGTVMVVFAPQVVALVLGPSHPPGSLPAALALLVAATILNNLMHLPHGVQLAAGDSLTALRFSAAGAVAYVALLVFATPPLGVIAPGLSLFTINVVTSFFFVRVSHRLLNLPVRLSVGRLLLRPAVAAAVVVGIVWLVLPGVSGFVTVIAAMVCATLAASAMALAVSPEARAVLARFAAGGRGDK